MHYPDSRNIEMDYYNIENDWISVSNDRKIKNKPNQIKNLDENKLSSFNININSQICFQSDSDNNIDDSSNDVINRNVKSRESQL